MAIFPYKYLVKFKEEQMKRFIGVFILLVLLNSLAFADFDFSKIKDNVSEFTLPNGLKFILLEDHSVPIATFMTYVNAGGSDERIGIWGISHFLEHMAFKGTSEVGTNNIKAEREILAKMDTVFDRLIAEKNSLHPDQEKIKKMEAELGKLQEEATQYAVDEFDNILKQNGGVGMNAFTNKDATVYLVSLPSNRMELWAYLESSRFTDPVFREFYKERNVIKEERRMGVENRPTGKLLEELMAIAFKDHPYHVNGIGPMSNIENITRADMYAYFKANYTAKNMVIGVAGDVYPDQLKKMVKTYFSKLNPGRKNSRVFTNEPKQAGEKTVTIYEDSQPWLVIGYHCPSILHEDFIKFSVLDRILTSGRSSRLNKQMVIQDKSALNIFSRAGSPGDKYPCLYFIGALPNTGHTTDKLLESIDSEIEKVKKHSVTREELDSAKTRVKVTQIRRMQSNFGLLLKMLGSEMKLGSWEKAFDDLQAIEKITANDIRELVKKYLTRNNRSIARIEKEEKKEEVEK
jgi:predicted Zn-dependent peptidase